MQTDDEKRAYGRGYSAGSNRAWPEHRPPYPPKKVVATFVKRATAVRDGLDSYLATLMEDDDLVVRLGPVIDEFDEACMRITDWLKSKEN